MKITITTIFSIAFTLIVSLFAVQPVFAHGDDARIEISAERLNPGGVLDIRGVDFESEEEVTLTLVGPQTEIPLGAVTADIEGVFQLATALPVDLAEGAYVVRGTTLDGHILDSPKLAIWGIADMGNEDGQRSEEDLLLAPMPTIAAGAPTPMMSSTTAAQTNMNQENKTETPTLPYSLIAAGVGIAVLLIFFLVLKKR